jgi:DNA adenine methylase
MGSKRRLAPRILPLIPDHTCYVEVFAGSAALLFAREEPSAVEVINDLDGELVNLFRVLKHHLEEFCNQFKWAVVSRQIFEWSKQTPPEVLTDIQRAARFYYLQRLCFGSKATGRTFGYSPTTRPRLNLVRIEEGLSEVHARLHQVVIENLTWESCIARYDRPGTFFFVDPPYLGLAGYEAGGRWEVPDFERLAATLAGIQGKALLTINDHPEMRRVFAAFHATTLKTRYTVGRSDASRAEASELLFQTWSPEKRDG